MLNWVTEYGGRSLGGHLFAASKRRQPRSGPASCIQHFELPFRRWEEPIGPWAEHFGKGRAQVYSLDGGDPLRSCNEVEVAKFLRHIRSRAFDEKRLLRLQRQLAKYRLLIVDELGFVPLSKTGAELLFEVFSQRYERGSTLVTSNLPFDEWTEVFGSERLTGALLDRLTHHVHILEMNGESYRLNQSRSQHASHSG